MHVTILGSSSSVSASLLDTGHCRMILMRFDQRYVSWSSSITEEGGILPCHCEMVEIGCVLLLETLHHRITAKESRYWAVNRSIHRMETSSSIHISCISKPHYRSLWYRTGTSLGRSCQRTDNQSSSAIMNVATDSTIKCARGIPVILQYGNIEPSVCRDMSMSC
jgi:hypothetical protein